jgi:hypothetical protein
LFFLNDEVNADILEMVGAHCSSAIKNALIMEKLERHNIELAALNRIANSISTYPDNASLLDSGLAKIMAIYQALAGAIYLWDEKANNLKLVIQKGLPEKISQNMRFPDKKGSPVTRLFLHRMRYLQATWQIKDPKCLSWAVY